MRASLVLPCYNEAASLGKLIDRCERVFDRTSIQVIFVDNGSSDDTPAILSRLEHPNLKHIRVPVNQGYGYGILCGLKAADTPILSWSHADLQTDPKDVLTAYQMMMESPSPETTFIKGHRYGRAMSDTAFTVGMSVFESILMQSRLWDINAQPVMFHQQFFHAWHHAPKDFALDLYAFHQARTQGLTVKRFPVHFGKREHGTSHWNVDWASKWRFIRRTVEYSWALKRAQAKKSLTL
ncbi:MAG: glycosyl transferase family 2 [Legionellales bacterium]|nr:glycosyl transferase family 2 [Legionellales bacterium]|tara:strand:- start:302 stop:1015 length:714 start_codon:yes stop_codon:yes gene_type:complete